MKRHTSQNKKQKNGAYFTKNAADLLAGYEHLVKGKIIIDPFAGSGKLIEWALGNGATGYEAYDIEPKFKNTIQNDSLINPPDYTNKVLVTNPPYLHRNKTKGDKTTFDIYGLNDLYKCHLDTLFPTAETGIIILPSNFLSESSPHARRLFFKNYTIGKAKYYTYSVFPEATTGIVVFDFKKDPSEQWHSITKKFELEIHKSETDIETINIEISPIYSYLHGDDFFDYISDHHPLKIIKYDTKSRSKPNTKIVIGLLTNGRYSLGAHINKGDPLRVPSTTFTTYQISQLLTVE